MRWSHASCLLINCFWHKSNLCVVLVVYLSGADAYIDKPDREMDDLGVLVYDEGTS
jgi:hypothetical protein